MIRSFRDQGERTRYLEPLEDRRLFASYAAATVPELIAALKKSVELTPAGDAVALLFPAMANHQVGDPEAARLWFDRGADWIERHPMGYAWLASFRAEAEALSKLEPGKN